MLRVCGLLSCSQFFFFVQTYGYILVTNNKMSSETYEDDVNK